MKVQSVFDNERRDSPAEDLQLKNMKLTVSSPDVTENCAQNLDIGTGSEYLTCFDVVDNNATVVVVGTSAMAARILACVNSCNDLATESLQSIEVREVIANVMRQNIALMTLLKSFANNAVRIEHDSYDLAGHEDFDVEAVVKAAKEIVAEHDAARAVQVAA